MVIPTIDGSRMQQLVRTVEHIKNGVPRVLVPAINRALAKGRTEVKKEIRKLYMIKASNIPVAVERASYFSGTGGVSGAVTVHQGMLDLNKFRFNPTTPAKRPLYAQVKRGGGGIIASGFTAAMDSGYVGPFVRKGASRLPVKKLLTISAAIMASQPTVGLAVNKAMGDTLDKRMDHELKRVLAKGGKS
jgi:hypothetical protein